MNVGEYIIVKIYKLFSNNLQQSKMFQVKEFQKSWLI